MSGVGSDQQIIARLRSAILLAHVTCYPLRQPDPRRSNELHRAARGDRVSPLVARTLNLIAQALTQIATGDYEHAKTMLRKAANQLDEL
jgi:hypothetical protein